MLTIAGGIVLAVLILYAIPFVLVGAGLTIGTIVEGINNFFKFCCDTIKMLLAPIAKGIIKLFNYLHIREENWGIALGLVVLAVLLVFYFYKVLG